MGEKPSFRNALRRRRCLILADGFYEWQKLGKQKRPMRIVMQSGELFAFAGLWETWRDPQGDIIPSCTIITTSANDTLSPIHNRMPVILPRDLEDLWLDNTVNDPDALTSVPHPLRRRGDGGVRGVSARPTRLGMMGRRLWSGWGDRVNGVVVQTRAYVVQPKQICLFTVTRA